MKETIIPVVGDVYRDKYGDTITWKNPRKVRIIELFPNGIRAEVIRNQDGSDLKRSRFSNIMFSTLRSSYVLWDTAPEG